MRTITYKSIACGPSGSFQPGDKRHDVPDGEAAALVNGGYATYADASPMREQAIPTLGEQAVSPAQPSKGQYPPKPAPSPRSK